MTDHVFEPAEGQARIDLHLHSAVSDGTDSPAELLEKVRAAGLRVFSLTDHDAFKGCLAVRDLLRDGDPVFLTGVEFSCRDELGKYHVLGYGYDPAAASMQALSARGRGFRIKKLKARLEFLKREFGFTFPPEETEELYHLDNPGKPHLGNLMVRHGFASTKEDAIENYLNRLRLRGDYLRPEEAIRGILDAGGVPVLAHPCYGDGDQLILGDELRERVLRLTGFGLRGLEACYSGFTRPLRDQVLALAEELGLYATAGSDYHGSNKMVILGDTGLDPAGPLPAPVERFLREVGRL